MAWQPLPEVVETTVETPEPKAFTLDPAKTVVVVVDMENYFCKLGNQRSYDVIEGNVTLLAKAREAGAKVIYVWSVRQLESPNHTVYKRGKNLLIGSWNTQIVEEIAPQPGETVIPKWSHDVWAWYGLEAELEREGIVAGEWTVLVTGVSAAGCANACALGFANRHYDVLIPLDATAASIEAEARTYNHYLRSYKSEIDYTLSTMVTFESPVAAEETKELAAAAAV
jgi:bifunctional isochorismate lyase/aryl carrier protein